MSTLTLHNAEEHGDLIAWLESHPDLHPYADQAAIWLDEQEHPPYPAEIPVPKHLVEAIEAAIEDWGEVLFSQTPREDFHSFVSEGAK